MPSPKKKQQQQQQQQQFQAQNYVATYFSIDVECVATGNEHNARDVAQIALVDQFERCLLNVYVKPPEGKKVHSYLTPLTGITEDVLSAHGVPLEDAMQHVRAALPPHAVLVGQNIAKDVEWLRLEEGKDFTSLVDLAGLWYVSSLSPTFPPSPLDTSLSPRFCLFARRSMRGQPRWILALGLVFSFFLTGTHTCGFDSTVWRVWNPQYKSWSVFSQDHLVKTLLGSDVGEQHNAALDALKSIRLFNYFNYLQSGQGGGEAALDAVKQKLLESPPEPSFAKKNPSWEGVCMGNRKTCTCGAPFFG